MEEVIRIKGQKLLEGTIHISGSKNLCVALIPASILARDVVVIHNIPPISDVYSLVEILEQLGICVEYHQDTLIIDSSNVKYHDLDMPAMERLRASYYFYSVLLGMYHKVTASGIGGCRLGERPIDLHIKAFEQLGTKFQKQENKYIFDGENLHAGHIIFDKISVGATINAILLAIQPEITELCKFLSKMGATIEGLGTDCIVIKGGKTLHGTTFYNIPDRIEVGTYALIGAATAKNLIIKNVIKEHIQALLDLFDILEVDYSIKENELQVRKSKIKKGIIVLTAPYPGFPTDLQQPLTSFLAVNEGTSVIIESIYTNRFAHIKELNEMGANINVTNMNIIIHGVKELRGLVVNGKDLRGAASLVIAGLIAKGETVVRGLEYINRGYENMIKKLRKVHANIELCIEDFGDN